MCFWSVAPLHEEVGFDNHILLGGDNIPHAELGNEYLVHLVFVPYVVLLEFLNVLCVDGRDSGFERHQVNHLLEGVLLTLDLLVHLELEEISTLGDVLDYWVDELWFIEMLSVQVVVPGGRSHLGLAKDKQEEPVIPTPLGCHEMSCNCCKLLDEVLHGVEGGFPKNGVNRDSSHPSSHHLGDGGHICRDFCNGCAVRSL